MMKKVLFLAVVLMLAGQTLLHAQTTDADKAAQYTAVITKRADKIVAKLGIADSAKYKRVVGVIADQYRSINDLHDARNAKVKQIKDNTTIDKAAATSQVKALDDELEQKINALHVNYLSKLGKDLSTDQVDRVKDEMTYNILPLTYKAYLDEVLNLTETQKAQIKTWLIEAREHAIDAESSEKKHAVFGKYKGRINNYLSSQGYDMKKEGEEWQKRIKAAKPSN